MQKEKIISLEEVFSGCTEPYSLLGQLDKLMKDGFTLKDGENEYEPLCVPSTPVELPCTPKEKEILDMYMQEPAKSQSEAGQDEISSVTAENLHLVPMTVQRYVSAMNVDILQEANLELVNAVRDYFSGKYTCGADMYCTFRIHRTVMQFLEEFKGEKDSSDIIKERGNAVIRIYEEFKNEHGTKPTVQYIAQRTGFEESFVRAIMVQLQEFERENPVHVQQPEHVRHKKQEKQEKRENADAVLKEKVEGMLCGLDDIQRKVIECRFGLRGKALTPEETATALGLDLREEEKIEAEAMESLKTM